MPYILRSEDGAIKAVSQHQMTDVGWEEVTSDDQQYHEYLHGALSQVDHFRESDIQLARVLEDLISLLIDRDFIRFTDFPDAAQKRLIERQGMRSRKVSLDLLDDEM